jgi:hypothetical protein
MPPKDTYEAALAVAREVGDRIAGHAANLAGRALFCPRGCDDGKQQMTTFGDEEDSVFCPHCNFSFRIEVIIGAVGYMVEDDFTRACEKKWPPVCP